MKTLLVALCALALAGCGQDAPAPRDAPEAAPAYVVVTDPQLACIVGRLLPPGVGLETVAPPDPEAHQHAWAPSREEGRLLRNASLIVTGGAGADGWVDLLGLSGGRIVRASRGLGGALIVVSTDTHSHGSAGEHSHVVHAPRPWLDPALTPRVIGTIAGALVESGIAETVDDATIVKPIETIRERFDGEAADVLVVTTRESWRYPARRAGAGVVVVEEGADPARVRVEVSASRATRIVLVGEIDAPGVGAALEGSGVQLSVVPLRDADCAWLDELDAFGIAITAGR